MSSRFDYSDDSDGHNSVDDQLSDILGGGGGDDSDDDNDQREMEPSPPVEPVVKPRSLKLKLSRPSAAAKPISSSSTGSTMRESARAAGGSSRRKSVSRRSGLDALDEELEDIAPAAPVPALTKKQRQHEQKMAKDRERKRLERQREKAAREAEQQRLLQLQQEDELEDGSQEEEEDEDQRAASIEPVAVVKGKSSKRASTGGEPSSKRAKVAKSSSARGKGKAKIEEEDVHNVVDTPEIVPPTEIEGIVPEAIVKSKKPSAPRKTYKRKTGEPGPGKAWRKGLKKGMIRPVAGGSDGASTSVPPPQSSKLDAERPGMGHKRFSDIAPSSDVEGSANGEISAKRLKKLKAAHLARLGDGSESETFDSDMPKAAMDDAASVPRNPAASAAPNRKSLFIPIGVKVDLAAPADAKLLGHPIFKNHIPGRAIPIKLIPPMPTKAEERERNREIDEMENRKKGASKPPPAKALEIGPRPRQWCQGRRAIIGVAGATLLLKTWIGQGESEWDAFKREKQQQEAALRPPPPPMSLGRLPAIPADGSSSAVPSPAIPGEGDAAAETHSEAAATAPGVALPVKKKDPRGRKPGVKNKPKLHSYKDAYRGGATSNRTQGSTSAMETGSAYNESPAASVRAESPLATSSTKKNPVAKLASEALYDSESAAGDAASPMDVDAEMDDIM